MKLSKLFTFVVDRTGQVLRFTLPVDHTVQDLERAQRLTERLPRIFDLPASEARTDHLDMSDSPTFQMPAVTPARENQWFEKGDG